MRREEIAGELEVSEADVIRHFTRLSKLNMSIDAGLYPLGSCTMKHNPRINEEIARYDGFWESGLKAWDTAAGCLLVRHHSTVTQFSMFQ